MDGQLMILENLKIHALLKVAQINRYFSMLASDSFRWTYANRVITIQSTEFMNDFNEFHFARNFDRVIVSNLEMASEIIDVSGVVLPKLYIKCTEMNLNNLEKLMQEINEHCRQSLIEFEMKDCPRGFRNFLKIPNGRKDNIQWRCANP